MEEFKIELVIDGDDDHVLITKELGPDARDNVLKSYYKAMKEETPFEFTTKGGTEYHIGPTKIKNSVLIVRQQ